MSVSSRWVPFLPWNPDQWMLSDGLFRSLCRMLTIKSFPEPPGLRTSVENKPEGRGICLRVRQHPNGCEIIAQPMSHGLHLFHAVGNDPNRVRQNAIQLDAVGKPLLQRLAEGAGRPLKG